MIKQQFDCKGGGCGECRVCEYLDFIDVCSMTSVEGSLIERDAELEKYIQEQYVNKV